MMADRNVMQTAFFFPDKTLVKRVYLMDDSTTSMILMFIYCDYNSASCVTLLFFFFLNSSTVLDSDWSESD